MATLGPRGKTPPAETGGGTSAIKYECSITGSDMKVKITVPGFQGGDSRVIDATAKKQ